MPVPAGKSHRSPWRAVKDFYWKAYEDNLTGLSGMVAYNLLLSVFPLALLALFIAGQVLESGDLEARVSQDLGQLFPSATDGTLERALQQVRRQSTSFGVVALVASIYIGSSFWGALDTAFGRIYHGPSRTWLQQKRFALLMLVFVLLFMAATVAVPALQSLLVTRADDLPLGLSNVHGVIYAVTLAAGLLLTFAILCLIYTTVPKERIPWRAIWPGALAATVAIGIVDYAFPFYLSSVSTARFGTTFVFIVIVLVWFYALAAIILGGATINAMRHEIHATGELRLPRDET